jgi:hypothetical protein
LLAHPSALTFSNSFTSVCTNARTSACTPIFNCIHDHTLIHPHVSPPPCDTASTYMMYMLCTCCSPALLSEAYKQTASVTPRLTQTLSPFWGLNLHRFQGALRLGTFKLVVGDLDIGWLSCNMSLEQPPKNQGLNATYVRKYSHQLWSLDFAQRNVHAGRLVHKPLRARTSQHDPPTSRPLSHTASLHMHGTCRTVTCCLTCPQTHTSEKISA